MQSISENAIDSTPAQEKLNYNATDAMTNAEARTRTLSLIIGAAAIGLLFWFLQNRTDALIDVDAYYHIKWTQLLWEGIKHGKFPPAFPWLPLTSLNPKDYVDHHLFFHILLIPFTWIGDLRLAAKAAATFFGSCAVFSCFWLIIRYRIRYPLVWLVALMASSAPFLYRMSMTRAQTVSIVLMVTGIHLLFQRKYLWLAPLAFLYVWTYSLFVSLIGASIIWSLVTLWEEGRFDKDALKQAARAPLYTIGGAIAGFVINPYFPKNIKLFVEHLLMKARLGDFQVAVGQEWYAYSSDYLLRSCIVAFVAMVAGYIAFGATERKRSARPLFFLLFSTTLLVVNFYQRRWVEYWPPFAILFAAFALQPFLATLFKRDEVSRLPTELLDELQPLLDRQERAVDVAAKKRREQWGMIGAAVVAVFLCVPLVFNVRETANTIKEEDSPFAYQKGMAWIKQNVPKGEMVFNTDWDDFPKMFFYDSDHVYASGLDPTYLFDQNKELSKLYEQVTLGKTNDPAPIIRDKFGARYVFSDTADVHEDFYNNAMDSGWFEEVYSDSDCRVLKILDEKKPSAEKKDEQNKADDDSTSDDDDDGDTPDEEDQ